MAKKKKTSACYDSPTFKKRYKEWYELEVEQAQKKIEDVVRKIYEGDFPTDEKCSRRIELFNDCSPIYIADKDKEKHYAEIRSALESIFMLGRSFGRCESQCTECSTE